MTKFNNLELSLIEWFIQKYDNSKLSKQLKNAKISKRDYTGHGYFTYLVVPKTFEKVDLSELNYNNWPIDGPIIISKYIDDNGECILWGDKGYISCIEMYAFGDKFSENIVEFTFEIKKE